jgi:hypothetical protein
MVSWKLCCPEQQAGRQDAKFWEKQSKERRDIEEGPTFQLSHEDGHIVRKVTLLTVAHQGLAPWYGVPRTGREHCTSVVPSLLLKGTGMGCCFSPFDPGQVT